jgi:hypothetical protein
MADNPFDFAVGQRCRLNDLGRARNPRSKKGVGTIIGKSRSPNSIRVLFDGFATPVPLHKKYIEVISTPPEQDPSAMKRPKEIANRLGEQRDQRKLASDVGFLHETFTLSVDDARAKARKILNDYPTGGYMTIVENWRQLSDGQIEFTMRRLPTAD